MQRITEKHLRNYCDQLNQETGSPREYWRSLAGSERKTAIGHFCISGAYGGWQLQRVANESGGVHTISSGGHIPARHLLDQIQCTLETLRQLKGN